jgi:ELWxxDGT repeat protein
MVQPRRRASLLLLLAAVGTGTPCLAGGPEAQDTLATSPIRVLDLSALGERVEPGDLFVRAGDAWLFWLDDLDDSGTPGQLLDDKVRLALWRTDGTPEGTFPLIPPNLSFYYYAGSLDDVAFVVLCKAEEPIDLFDAEVYLCDAPFDLELWRTDGTPEGTFRLSQKDRRDLYWTRSPIVAEVSELGLFFFLTRDEEKAGYELWATDGSREGTRVVKNLSKRGLDGVVDLRSFQGEVFFLGGNGSAADFRMWVGRSDGTPAGTKIFRAPDHGKIRIASLIPGLDLMFLIAERFTEPGGPGTFQRKTLWALKKNKRSFRRLGELGTRGSSILAFAAPSQMFFRVSSGGLTDLWSSDGIGPPTRLAADMRSTGLPGYVWAEPWALAGGRAFVTLFDRDHGTEPWITDGTPAGTERLANLCHKECTSYPAGLKIFRDSFLFQAEDRRRGRELWRWRPEVDSPGTVEFVADFCRGKCSSWPLIHERIGDRLILAASERSGARRLWTLGPGGEDAQRIAEVADFNIGAFELIFNRRVEQVRLVGNRLVFWATDDEGRNALWSWPLPELFEPEGLEP